MIASGLQDRPPPLSPPECDLRGYDFMPLFGQRLFGSRFYGKALRSPRAGIAAFKLWWAAWQQCPAGSLPDDDSDLAIVADFGTDIDAWKNVRAIALHGFVQCSDGRLYHPILCTEAIAAYGRRLRDRERKAQLRARKRTGDVQSMPLSHETSTGSAQEFHSDRTGHDSDSVPHSAPARHQARHAFFSAARQSLVTNCGLSDARARSLLGKWLKQCRDNVSLLDEIFDQSTSKYPADRISWICAAINARTGSRQDALAQRWGLDLITDEDADLASLLQVGHGS